MKEGQKVWYGTRGCVILYFDNKKAFIKFFDNNQKINVPIGALSSRPNTHTLPQENPDMPCPSCGYPLFMDKCPSCGHEEGFKEWLEALAGINDIKSTNFDPENNWQNKMPPKEINYLDFGHHTNNPILWRYRDGVLDIKPVPSGSTHYDQRIMSGVAIGRIDINKKIITISCNRTNGIDYMMKQLPILSSKLEEKYPNFRQLVFGLDDFPEGTSIEKILITSEVLSGINDIIAANHDPENNWRNKLPPPIDNYMDYGHLNTNPILWNYSKHHGLKIKQFNHSVDHGEVDMSWGEANGRIDVRKNIITIAARYFGDPLDRWIWQDEFISDILPKIHNELKEKYPNYKQLVFNLKGTKEGSPIEDVLNRYPKLEWRDGENYFGRDPIMQPAYSDFGHKRGGILWILTPNYEIKKEIDNGIDKIHEDIFKEKYIAQGRVDLDLRTITIEPVIKIYDPLITNKIFLQKTLPFLNEYFKKEYPNFRQLLFNAGVLGFKDGYSVDNMLKSI